MSVTRIYKGWKIDKRGGFCTMSRFVAFKGNQMLWAFRLYEVKALIDCLDTQEYEALPRLNREPLYV